MKIMLDTTHILPFFGIETTIPNHKKELKQLLEREEIVKEIIISDVTILEIRWLMLRLKKKEKDEQKKKLYDERFGNNLEVIRKSQTLEIKNWYMKKKTTEIADIMLEAGHQDYIDCILIGQSNAEEAILVTEDKKIATLTKELKKKVKIKVVNWKALMNRIE